MFLIETWKFPATTSHKNTTEQLIIVFNESSLRKLETSHDSFKTHRIFLAIDPSNSLVESALIIIKFHLPICYFTKLKLKKLYIKYYDCLFVSFLWYFIDIKISKILVINIYG